MSSSVVLLGMGPAQAATSGWRQVHSQHYGPANDFSAYSVVVANGKNSAWALGGSDESGGNGTVQRPVAERWNGRAWRGYALPSKATSYITAASGPAANDIWAVTFSGGWVLHWNGSKWLVARHLPGTGELTGVTALSPRNVWVFGGGGETGGLGTWHYNGRTWQQWKSGNAVGLENASALSANNIWGIGGTLAPYSAIVHFNGRSWQKVSAKAFSGLQFRSVHAFGVRNVWATATAQTNSLQSWLVHYNGAGWSRIKLPWAMSAGVLTGDGHGGLWMTGFAITGPQAVYSSYVAHRTASGAWSRIKVGSGLTSGANLIDVALIPGTSSVWGVGFTEAKTHGGSAVIWAYGAV